MSARLDAQLRTIVAPVCDAMVAAVEERWHDTWRLLADVYPVLVRVGGSYAQREVIEETLLYALVCAARQNGPWLCLTSGSTAVRRRLMRAPGVARAVADHRDALSPAG